MRAVVVERFGGPEVLRLTERDRPEPVPTEILVRVRTAGVNPVDASTRAGKGQAAVLGSPPFVIGWDVCGVVEAVGRGVTRFAAGDRVFGMPWFPREGGAYADYVTAPSRQFAHRPSRLDDVSAGGLPLAGLIAWQALVDTAGVREGQRVLIHGAAGGVGHLAVQIAKSRGAYVLGTVRGDQSDFVCSVGLDQAIDYTDTAFEDVARDVDIVVDLVGSEEYGMRSLGTLRPDGLFIQVPSRAPASVLTVARAQGKRATGIIVEPDGTGLERLGELAESGALKVQIAEVLPLQEAARAHQRLDAGVGGGKIVLRVSDENEHSVGDRAQLPSTKDSIGEGLGA